MIFFFTRSAIFIWQVIEHALIVFGDNGIQKNQAFNRVRNLLGHFLNDGASKAVTNQDEVLQLALPYVFEN